MFVWELLPVAAPVRVEHTVDAAGDAWGTVLVGVEAPVGAPDVYRATHKLVVTNESRAGEQFLYTHLIPITYLSYLHFSIFS